MEKPLLVSVPLIKPILGRWKTETRRLAGLDKINAAPDRFSFLRMEMLYRREIYRAIFLDTETGKEVKVNSPYGGVGTNLWVRENWYAGKGYDDMPPRSIPADIAKVGYMADGSKPDWAGKTRPAIHIPRWLSRIELTNEATYPERLQSITEKDAKNEGVDRGILRDGPNTEKGQFQLELTCNGSPIGTFLDGFKYTFMTLNGRDIWEQNPWVWVIKFTLKTHANETL
jgi:hypothetical protein